MNNFERAAAWLSACGKEPGPETLSLQIGCDLEETAELLRCLPDVFVGTTPRLLAVVQELCTGMSESFATRGQALPPWRRSKAMMR